MFRILAICPRVRKEADCLIATTSWRIRLLFLYSLYRRVEINTKQRRIVIRSRYCWFFTSQRSIPFKEVRNVTYGYQEESISGKIFQAYDGLDSFSTGLRLKNDEQVGLFLFFGEGAFTNESILPDWMYWEEILLDLQGSQERESRIFVELLAKMIGVKVAPPGLI